MRSRSLRGATPASLPDALTAVLIAVLSVVVVYNAFHYPAVSGYDAELHIEYARTLVTEWRIPTELRNYYTPPGFFLVAGPLVELGDLLGLSDVADLGQLLDGALTVGTAILLIVLCAIVFPGRPWLRFASVAFFVSCPIVLKTAAMFHPQPLVAFLAMLAVVLCARMLRDRRYGIGAALALGLVVGAGQLVRSVGIWTLGVVCIALLAAAIARAAERRAALRALVIVGVVGVLIALPWYVYLQTRYSNPIFGRSSASLGRGRHTAPRSGALCRAGAVPARRGGAAALVAAALVLRRPRAARGGHCPASREARAGVLADPLHRHVGRLLRGLDVGLHPEADRPVDREPPHGSVARGCGARRSWPPPGCSRSQGSPWHACARGRSSS